MKVFAFVFLFIYRWIIYPFALILALLMGFLGHKKIRKSLSYRLAEKRKNNKEQLQNVVWVHCSSGEFEYAKSVIRDLKKKSANEKVLVTYFSPTYKENIEKFEAVDYVMPLPLDTPGAVRSFLREYKPKLLLIARTDLWPELLVQCNKHKISSLIFSVTQSKKYTGLKKVFYKWLYSLMSGVFVVSEDDSNNLKDLGLDQLRVVGDTRYDQCFHRLQSAAERNITKPYNENDFVWIAGSTWTEDEAVIVESLSQNINTVSGSKLMIVPHEPTKSHIEALQKKVGGINQSSILYSSLAKQVEESEQVVLVDQLGALAELYLQADAAFVGGSFKGSVHSVMEALAAGCYICVGPFYKNNREAIEFKDIAIEGLPLVTEVSDSKSLGLWLQQVQKAKASCPNIKDIISKEVEKKTGATEQVVQWTLEQ